MLLKIVLTMCWCFVVQVVDFENKGRGVVATKTFNRGDFVVEYAGDLISIDEAKERESNYAKDPTKGCYMYYFNFHNKKYWCVLFIAFYSVSSARYMNLWRLQITLRFSL